MADKRLIVYGYSDESTSFTDLGACLIAKGLCAPEDVYCLDDNSMCRGDVTMGRACALYDARGMGGAQ